ncbi:MAG: hypothetical protein ACTIBG_15480 [Brevibacterium aurantiacum]|uniref:hypothetical protein n=1 Tax=Brevibacterium aurantiacum TaxID=273384 RepID=UPI003F93ABCA
MDFLLAVGVAAILRAASLDLGIPLAGIIPRGDVDFSKRRKQKLADFQAASAAADLLFFEGLHEMDKAVSHYSRTPHYLLPLFGERSSFLNTEASRPFVSIVVPHEWDLDRQKLTELQYRNSPLSQLADFEIIDSDTLYSEKDFLLSRGFPGTIRYRISTMSTHIMVVGNSRDHAPLISALEKNHPDRYVLDATITNRDLALRNGIDAAKIGQGAALFRRLYETISAPAQVRHVDRPMHNNASTQIIGGVELVEHFAKVLRHPMPWWFEQEICDSEARDFDVFFSVAAVEDRADGARPMRIRAVSEQFGSDGVLTVRLSASEGIFNRRAEAILGMIQHGVRPRYFYGENSTAPMEQHVVDRLTDLMRRLKNKGIRSGWFVRDLHWLSDDADYSANAELTQVERVARGVYEARSMQGVADIFYAPSTSTVSMFENLLASHDVRPERWASLPPAVADYRILPPSFGVPSGPVKLVYSGGYGDVYGMNTLITALSSHRVPLDVTWYVRPGDNSRLIADLLSEPTGEGPDGKIGGPMFDLDGPQLPLGHQINNSEFLGFDPGHDRYIGLILLDSEYAKDSFPFKLMSYLEKRIPVAVYDDMAVADIVREYHLGIVCKRDGFTLNHLLERAQEFYSKDVNWSQIYTDQSWKARMAAVRNGLAGQN